MITQWTAQGESLVLLVDLNDAVVKGKTAARLRQTGMYKILTHDSPTYAPTHQRGSQTIDGIFELADTRIKIKHWTLAKRRCDGYKVDRKFFVCIANAARLSTSSFIPEEKTLNRIYRSKD
jgi:hypothetical protein